MVHRNARNDVLAAGGDGDFLLTVPPIFNPASSNSARSLYGAASSER